MSVDRARLEALWAGSTALREFRFEASKSDVLEGLSDEDVGRLYRSALAGRYSMQELCRALERWMAARPMDERNDDEEEPWVRPHDSSASDESAVTSMSK